MKLLIDYNTDDNLCTILDTNDNDYKILLDLNKLVNYCKSQVNTNDFICGDIFCYSNLRLISLHDIEKEYGFIPIFQLVSKNGSDIRYYLYIASNVIKKLNFNRAVANSLQSYLNVKYFRISEDSYNNAILSKINIAKCRLLFGMRPVNCIYDSFFRYFNISSLSQSSKSGIKVLSCYYDSEKLESYLKSIMNFGSIKHSYRSGGNMIVLEVTYEEVIKNFGYEVSLDDFC